jgi:alkylation response protein AidB-like acyl-CoA dehydrogenase
VLDGDRFVVNGQKVWTSGANYADFCFLFCRTDPDAPKHKGISVILVDMDTPGITVRPLPQIIHPQHPDLNEVFFEDVVVPAKNLLGELNNGWAMAGGSLGHERGMVWIGSVMILEEAIGRLLDDADAARERMSAPEHALLVDQVMQSYVDVQAARCLGYRGFAKMARGVDAPEQSLMKMFCSEAQRRLALVGSELLADQGADMTDAGRDRRPWIELYFDAFGRTISAGSSEIQRNIIAERVLGLPRS